MLSFLRLTQGLSTYDYIVAMRELDQEQEQLGVEGQQSPQMSTVSSFTGLSSVSSFNALHRGAWCTPPRMFLEDQVTFSIHACFFLPKMAFFKWLSSKHTAAFGLSSCTLKHLNVYRIVCYQDLYGGIQFLPINISRIVFCVNLGISS